MTYGACVALAIAVGLIAARHAPPDSVPPNIARVVRIAALVGAIVGAHMFELPADLFGWTAVPDHGGTPLLGRTVLGGILGGWIAVELAKARLGFRGATGDRFAAPLAMSLAIGRLGCVLSGCCPGAPVPETSIWGRIVPWDATPRFPATLVEAYFHAIAAMVLLVLAHRDVLRGRRLAGYVAVLSVVRFALEEGRANPEIALGLTYYQWLSIALGALAAGTFVARTRVAAGSVVTEHSSALDTSRTDRGVPAAASRGAHTSS